MDHATICVRRGIEETFAESERCRADGDGIRTVTLDFGRVPVNDTAVKAVKICNASRNDESYEVHGDPITNPLDAVFHFHAYSWSLPPDGTLLCRVLYRPFLPRQRSVDYFTLVNSEKQVLRLVLRGESIGPNVTISSDTLVMICRPGGKAKTRATLINDSDVPATFSFDVDEAQSSFKPAPTEGRVRARSHVDIVVTFEPALEGPQSMYIPCLLQHQAPIMLRVYGYCGTKYTTDGQFNVPTIVYPPQVADGFEGYMTDCSRIRSGDARLSFHPISLSNGYLDFGRLDAETRDSNLRPLRTTSFANHTQRDMLIKWHEDIDGVFEVSPRSARVNAGEACLFEVRFDSDRENVFFARELTALVFWIGRSDSLPVYAYSMIVSIRVMGHTFLAGSSSLVARYRVPQSVIMPACLPSRPVYTTFLIRKLGNSPLMYSFLPPKETRFTVKPMLGVIYKSFQPIVVEMFPEDRSGLLYERWAIRFNGNRKYDVSIDFRGYAEYPCLSFDYGSSVNFPSTHPGCERVERVAARNTSRHRITYVYEDVPSILKITRDRGDIFPNGILVDDWTFCPVKEDDYEFDVSCRFAASAGTPDRETTMEIQVRVTGKSERGYLVAMPSELNFGERTYDETGKLDFRLINPSPVEIRYVLTVRDSGWPYEEAVQHRVLIEPISGTLCPGDSAEIQVSLTPRKRGFHESSIRYFIPTNIQTESLATINDSSEICRIKYFCVLPTIKIGDLLHHTIDANISKDVLYRLLHLKKLNSILNDLQPDERADIEMNLPPKVIQDEALFIKLSISNPTSTPVSWSMKQIILSSETTFRGNHRHNSQPTRSDSPHRKLCTINPRSAILQPREKVMITMELRYAILGENNVKWKLNIGHGRHVCLCIKMIGLSGNERIAIPLYGPRIDLKKIYIGDRDPVNQVCWLYNPTKNDIDYSFDRAAFERFNEDHGAEVFALMNPSGIVRALSYKPVLIKFQSTRWGTFEVAMPLMLGEKMTTVTINGESSDDPLTRISEDVSQFRDTFHIPEVPVYFNTDKVMLPATPTHSRLTRMIMIHNSLEHDVIAYEWMRYELPGIIELSVEPIKGRIQPDSLQTFRLIVVTGGKPCSFQADVNCVFINQTEKRAYEKKIFLHNSLCDEMKDYFIITEKGTSIPKPETLVLEAPKPFNKALSVRCYIYSPQDEELKTTRNERLKHTPSIEVPVGKESTKILASAETMTLSKFILEGMIWDILQTTNMFSQSSVGLRYSQIAMGPLQRRRMQDRSRVTPSGRMLERLLENMIFMIVHKEFALDMIHLTQTTDARQAVHQKMWQQVPSQTRLE